MKIEKEILEDRQAQLTVEYSQNEFDKIKQRAARKISKKAKIPGFRPGKAPYSMIVNHYGHETIVQEAIDLLIDEDYAKILKEAEIEPSGIGRLESLENYDPPKFVLFVPLEPEIDLGDYREIRKPYDPAPFDEESVEDYIENLRRNSATIIPADHPAEVGDLVYFNLSGEFLNPSEDEDATITDKTPQQVLIMKEDETNDHEWPYPGFSRTLIGVNSGEIKELQYAYPENYEDQDFQGKTAIFTVDVQSVKALELPELDDNFVQNLGNFESVDEFRSSIEKEMRSNFEESIELDYTNSILNEIIDTAKLVYPPQMLEHEEEHVLEDIESRLNNQKMDLDTYIKLKNTDKAVFLEEEVRPVAKKRLERSLITNALIKAEDLKLNQNLVQENFSIILNEILTSGQAENLQKEMGNDDFSRMLSMEAMNRAIELQLRNRLKLIGTGQPIPEDDETTEGGEDSPTIDIELFSDDDGEIEELTETLLSEADDVREENLPVTSKNQSEGEPEGISDENAIVDDQK